MTVTMWVLLVIAAASVWVAAGAFWAFFALMVAGARWVVVATRRLDREGVALAREIRASLDRDAGVGQ